MEYRSLPQKISVSIIYIQLLYKILSRSMVKLHVIWCDVKLYLWSNRKPYICLATSSYQWYQMPTESLELPNSMVSRKWDSGTIKHSSHLSSKYVTQTSKSQHATADTQCNATSRMGGGLCITTTIWSCRKPISQWQFSFHMRATLSLVKKLETAQDRNGNTGPWIQVIYV